MWFNFTHISSVIRFWSTQSAFGPCCDLNRFLLFSYSQKYEARNFITKLETWSTDRFRVPSNIREWMVLVWNWTIVQFFTTLNRWIDSALTVLRCVDVLFLELLSWLGIFKSITCLYSVYSNRIVMVVWHNYLNIDGFSLSSIYIFLIARILCCNAGSWRHCETLLELSA